MLKEIQKEIGKINIRIKELEEQIEFLKEKRKFLIDKLTELAPPCVNDNCDFYDEDAFNNCIYPGTHFKCSEYVSAFKYKKEDVF